MRDLSARGPFARPEALRLFLILRMMVLALVVGAGIMIMQLSQGQVAVVPLYILLVLSYAVGGVFYAGWRLGLNPIIGLWMLMIADIAIETAMLRYSGGAASPFSLVFCLTIISAALLLEIPGGVAIAALASICYIGYGAFHAGAGGPIAHELATGENAALSPTLLKSYMHVSLFFLVGAMGGYLAARNRRGGSELHSAEVRLEQLKIDTENILNNMSSGVLVIDSAGKIISANPTASEILGIAREEMISHTVENAFAARMSELGRELQTALTSGQSKQRHEMALARSGARELPLGISISLLRDDGGETRGVIAVFQDLTQVRDMQIRMRKADRLAAIGELSAGIAHEIRNPLASISGAIEMLSKELALDGENRRLMDLVMRESDRLDRIITDFLEFARLRPPSLEHTVLGECLDDVLTLIKSNASVIGKIRIEVRHADAEVHARCDDEQMKQVFFNLARNACEAMEGAGTLRIDMGGSSSGWITITFRDEGPGVSEEARRHLFEPFFTTKDGGTGLGLAIANKIVEAHGGRINVRNGEHGAVFAVTLPGAERMRSNGEQRTLTSVVDAG